MEFGASVFGRRLGFDEVTRMDPCSGITVLLKRDTKKLALSLSYHLQQTKDHGSIQREDGLPASQEVFPPKPDHAGILIADFQPSEL